MIKIFREYLQTLVLKALCIKRCEENTDRLCFAENGLLKTEYQHLYKALFDQSVNHEAIVSTLAKSKYGLGRLELSKKSDVSIGGPFTRTMEDLLLSGFVVELQPFGKVKQRSVYRLTDEFSVFYHRFISTHKKSGKGIWKEISQTQSYKIWLGYAFEALCLRHIDKIKKAMGIANLYSEVSSFRSNGNSGEPGIPIDIILDRSDKTVNICECKYYSEPFEITKPYATTLNQKKELFKKYTGTRKNVFTILICNQVPKKNDYLRESVDKVVVMEDLF